MKQPQIATPFPAATTVAVLDDIAEETKARSVYDRPEETFPAIEKMGAWLAKSGMFGVKNLEQGFVVAMTCFEERITPLEFRRRYHIIEGTPSKRADRMQADFQSRGGRITWIEYTSEVCEALFLHPEYQPKGITIRVTLKEMREKGVTRGQKGEKDNWAKWPRSMLKARVISEGVRQVDPGVCSGEYTPEELDEMLDRGKGANVVEQESTATNVAPSPAPQDPPTTKEAPVPPQGPTPQERCKRVVEAFRVYTLTQEDLEAHAGDYETGEVVEAKDWADEHYARFTETLEKIKAAKGEERKHVICELFNLPGAALEG